MLVKQQKIQPTEEIENACHECNGVGKVLMMPCSLEVSPFAVSCSHCLGEKVITLNLLERKESGRDLKQLLHENDLTIREASKKFGQTFSEWLAATQGHLTIAEIETKMSLLRNAPNL